MVFDEKAVMQPIDDDELPIEGDSDDDDISDYLQQLQKDQSDDYYQDSEGAPTPNNQGVEGATNNSGNGIGTLPSSDQSEAGPGDNVIRPTSNSHEHEINNSNEHELIDANKLNNRTSANGLPESESSNGQSQTNQDGPTGQITTAVPSSRVNNQSARDNKSHKVVPEPTRRSNRDKTRIDYSQINKKGIKSTDNPDGFRAMLTRVVAGSKDRPCPISMDEALRGPDSDKWLAAAEEELANHTTQQTWQAPCNPPPKAHILPGRWVLSYKFGPIGEINRYKARWVVKGFHQIEGIDFNETFSSTLKATSWRLLLALVAKHGLVIECLDVVAAFLESLVREEI